MDATSESDWMTHPEYFSLGDEWAIIGLLVLAGMYFVLVVGMGFRPIWAVVGVALLPATLVLLVLWSMLPVWLTRTLLVAGVVDQMTRKKPAARSSLKPSSSVRYSQN